MVHNLILCPADGGPIRRDIPDLVQCLAHSGLISATPLTAGGHDFAVGARFLERVVFLGCSPAIELEPGEHDFCHVSLLAHAPPGRIYRSPQGRPPRCPACGQRMRFEDLTTGNPPHCHSCGETSAWPALLWDRSAGRVEQGIAIRHVHPHEAVPTDALIQTLVQETGQPWRYFYGSESIHHATPEPAKSR